MEDTASVMLPEGFSALSFGAAFILAAVGVFLVYRLLRPKADFSHFAPKDNSDERRSVRRSCLWLLPFIVLTLVPGIWCLCGAAKPGFDLLLAQVFVTVGCGLASLLRPFFFEWAENQGDSAETEVFRALRDFFFMALSSILAAFALEATCNPDSLALPFSSCLYSFVYVFVLMLMCYFLAQRHGAACVLVVVLCLGFGIAEHFVTQFKSQAILPSDILAAQTAAEVVDGYSFEFGDSIYIGMLLAALAILPLVFVGPSEHQKRGFRVLNFSVNLMLFAASLSMFVGLFCLIDTEEALGFDLSMWEPIETYEENGFIPAFNAAMQDLPIEVPEGYSTEAAQSLQATLAASFDKTTGASSNRKEAVKQFESEKPSVIAIMNEGFADLSCIEAVAKSGYSGPGFVKSLSTSLQRGALRVSVQGGGTAVTEFEFLTGNSLAYIGVGKQPYQLYDLSDIYSLPKQLAAAGYDTTAIHPEKGGNYRRDVVYGQLGFNTFITKDDFAEDAPYYHRGITDAATYDKALEILKSDEDPQFIFDVTMMNHGGYDDGTVPAGDAVDIDVGTTDESVATELRNYLGSVNRCDSELKDFIEELRELDRPVVVVFFGDHQPSFSSVLCNELYGEEDAEGNAERYGQTPYFIWANYNVSGNAQKSDRETIGANELAARTLSLIGAPLTDYQKAMLSTRSKVAAFSLYGALNSDGSFYGIEDSDNPNKETLQNAAMLEYLNFGSKVQ